MTEGAVGGAEAALEAWKKQVETDLEGMTFEGAMRTSTLEGISLPALATRRDVSLPDPKSGPTIPLPSDWRWSICPRLDQLDLSSATRAAADDVAGGADALLLQIGPSGLPIIGSAELAGVLAPVEARPIPIYADAGSRFAPIASLLDAWWANLPEAQRKGGYGADPLAALAAGEPIKGGLGRAYDELAALCRRAIPAGGRISPITVSSEPYHRAGASYTEEIAALLATTVAYLRALDGRGIDPAALLPLVTLRVFVGCDLFLSIAALRACRIVFGALAAEAKWPTGITLFAESSPRMLTRREPATNLLRVTAATFAAAVGRADLITTHGFDAATGPASDLGRRYARNTQLVLEEEAGLGAVVDPAGGSWWLELASEKIAGRAWARFREIEARGGMEKVLLEGWWQGRLARISTERSVEVRRRKLPITGVSSFADSSELLPDAGKEAPPKDPAPRAADDLGIEPLPLVRSAAAFEALRDRADRHTRRLGSRPTVFLAKLGPRSAHTARAGFVTQLLAAGGLSVVEHEAESPPDGLPEAFTKSGARGSVICSSDTLYEAHVPTVATSLQLAGSRSVVVAGRPGEQEEAWRAAGVDFFLFLGGDAVEALERLFAVLEVAP